MSENNKDLEVRKSSEVGQAMKMSKEDLEAMGGMMEQEDITVPRMVVLQGLSPEVNEGKGRPGEFYVKGFERNLGKGPIEFIVLMRSKSRIRWRDLKLGGGILCQSADAIQGHGDPGVECKNCPFAEWGGTDGKPGCDLYQNIIIVLRKDEDWVPMALSGNRTKLKAIKNLNSLLMLELTKSRPLFSKSYLIEPMARQNSQGMQFYSYRISPANENALLPDVDQRRAWDLFNNFKGRKIEIMPEEQVEAAHVSEPSKEF